MMKHRETGLVKKGFYGYSWTLLFFGGFVPLFRGRIGMAILLTILQFLTWGIGTFIFSFFYNKQYTSKLIERGYVFCDLENKNAMARAKIGVEHLA